MRSELSRYTAIPEPPAKYWDTLTVEIAVECDPKDYIPGHKYWFYGYVVQGDESGDELVRNAKCTLADAQYDCIKAIGKYARAIRFKSAENEGFALDTTYDVESGRFIESEYSLLVSK